MLKISLYVNIFELRNNILYKVSIMERKVSIMEWIILRIILVSLKNTYKKGIIE